MLDDTPRTINTGDTIKFPAASIGADGQPETRWLVQHRYAADPDERCSVCTGRAAEWQVTPPDGGDGVYSCSQHLVLVLRRLARAWETAATRQ